MSRPLLTFYGDDFTGSTDALEQLTLAGIRTALFIEPPTPRQLARFENLQAIGVAGMTRSLTPAAMRRELRPALKKLKLKWGAYGTWMGRLYNTLSPAQKAALDKAGLKG